MNKLFWNKNIHSISLALHDVTNEKTWEMIEDMQIVAEYQLFCKWVSAWFCERSEPDKQKQNATDNLWAQIK